MISCQIISIFIRFQMTPEFICWEQSLNKDLKQLSKAVNIEEQRFIFLTISKSLSDATQKLGVEMNQENP